MADLHTLKNQVASQVGVQFGSKQQNRNLTSAQCGQVGGIMVKQALSQVWGDNIRH